ncbi:MAG: hypothetical protein K9J12_11390 [Melioribacteraceae bacterium]|nr:hypothetical protein [Melioribacteraceae bacterium]MCF8263957.1 hypothetical protein [Melioribacteraceae bacterium]MCF8411809.1 hypothetical protein [Melioribacteraceae bacterium]
MKNIYDSEQNEHPISKILAQMPKLDAPDNFEYNLMVKINNGNFDTHDSSEAGWKLSWLYAPITALASSVFLLFYLYSPINDSTLPLITDDAQTISNNSVSKQFVWAEEVGEKFDKSDEQSEEIVNDAYQVVLQPNDVVETRKIDPSILKGKGSELDVDLSNKGLKASRGRGTLVSAGGVSQFNFDGFYVIIDEKADSSKAEINEKNEK